MLKDMSKYASLVLLCDKPIGASPQMQFINTCIMMLYYGTYVFWIVHFIMKSHLFAVLPFCHSPFCRSTIPPVHSSIPPICRSVIPPFHKSIPISRNDHNVLSYLSYQHTDVHCEVQRSAPLWSPEEQNCASSASWTYYIWIALRRDGKIWRTFQYYEWSEGCWWRKYDEHGAHGKK